MTTGPAVVYVAHWSEDEWCHTCHMAQPCDGIRGQFATVQGQIRAVLLVIADWPGSSARMLARDVAAALGYNPDDDDADPVPTMPNPGVYGERNGRP